MPEGLEGGVVVHDGFKPYRRLDSAAQPPAHALCNAHHLRELKTCANSRRSLSSTTSPGL
jgi:hypothetical protein